MVKIAPVAEQQVDQKPAVKKLDGPIEVCFFGNFSVTMQGVLINDSASRARQPWNLLQILMVHRNQPLSRQQLLDALWPDGASDQPGKALKNLVYRVRSSFAMKNVAFAQDIILYQGGSYMLNNDLDWWFDFEQAEQLMENALSAEAKIQYDDDQRIESMLSAIRLYKGDFLSEQIYEDWVLPYHTYFRSRFLDCLQTVLEMLRQKNRDEDIEFVCNQAIGIEPFEEWLHLEYLQALARQEKKAIALEHYNKMSEMFYREMGVSPNEDLKTLYRQLSAGVQSTVTDLDTIKDILGEHEFTNDAFYCDFEVFRSLYRLEARTAQRAGQGVFLVLLTLTEDGSEIQEDEKMNDCMSKLLECVNTCLRRGDVVCRFSLCQYILLLPTITLENARAVMDRLQEHMRQLCSHEGIHLQIKIQTVSPIL